LKIPAAFSTILRRVLSPFVVKVRASLLAYYGSSFAALTGVARTQQHPVDIERFPSTGTERWAALGLVLLQPVEGGMLLGCQQ
jgi:hypothetical protein